jgi:DNA-binding transcriptional LysR family regulator
MDTGELDLNLLSVFRALMDERSVTKAAARVRLTQSATSNALARLRRQLGDPLFIRTQQGMLPTARAQALDEPIRMALEQIGNVMRFQMPFSPTESDRAFRIMVTDHALTKVAPLLAGILSQDAPSIRFDISSVAPETDYERLRAGDADLMISFIVVQPPPSFKTMKLFSERHVVLARRGHPTVGSKLTLQDYVDADHVLVAPRGGWLAGPIDQILAEKGLKRKVRMAIPHYLAAPHCVAFSDMLVTLPESVAAEYAKILPVTVFDFPFATRLFTVSMVWHDRNHDDPAHRWLRRKVKEACRGP